MKKIDILNSALAESGLTAEAVVKSWYESNQISAEFLQQLCPVGEKTTFQDMNFIPSKKFVTPKKVEPGMFYYADGLIFPEMIMFYHPVRKKITTVLTENHTDMSFFDSVGRSYRLSEPEFFFISLKITLANDFFAM